MRFSSQFLTTIFGLFSYPLYIILNSLFYSLFSGLVYHEWKFDLLLFGFPCKVPQTIENITFFSVFIGLRLLLYFLGVIFLRSLLRVNLGRFILLLLSIFCLFDFYSILAFITDEIFESYLRFFFYSTTPLYKLSYALNIPVLIIPLVSVGTGMFFVIRFLNFFSKEKIILLFGSNFASLIISGIILKYMLGVSVFNS